MKEFADLDFDRKKRTGFHEVVFCQGKKDDFLVKIFADLYEKNGCQILYGETALKIDKKAKSINVKLVDHIIISKDGYYSFLHAQMLCEPNKPN